MWTLSIWVVCLPIAFELPPVVGINPFHLRGAMIPILVGAVLLTAMLFLGRRWCSPGTVSDIAAGLFGGWTALTMRTALNGTPYGFDGLWGDVGRMAAMATRYTVTWRSSDGIVGSVPSEYPPLFPWLIGRSSVLLGTPAWKLLGVAEILTISAAVVAGYLLWRRLVPGPVALAATIAGFAVYNVPEKAFEVITLVVIVPWVLAAFGEPPRGRLHWLPAGLIGGLSILVYQGYLMFGTLGVLVLIVITWKGSPRRREYVRHLVATAVVALVVSSWFLVPYVSWSVTHGLQRADLWQDPKIANSPLPFLAITPLAYLELAGVIGLLWYRTREWWATPLILLTASCYAYRFAALAGFILNGHTEVLQYSDRLIEVLLATAGVLTVVRAVPDILRRLRARPPAGLPALGLSVLVAFVAVTSWKGWMPGQPTPNARTFRSAVTSVRNGATIASQTQLPDGRYPKYAPVSGRIGVFPVDEIVSDVESVRGVGARPAVLSANELIFSYVPWNGYEAVALDAAGATTRWFARFAALHDLEHVRDPARFSSASGHTRFGPIDVFILNDGGRHWDWAPADFPEVLTFTPAQFASSDFVTFHLRGGLVVVVRKPAR